MNSLRRAFSATRLGSGVTLILLLLLGSSVPCAATEDGSPFVAFNSMQTFSQDGEKVAALRIPVYITLRSWQDRPLGLRLRLAASFAAVDLYEFLEEPDIASVNVLSFVPGLEFIVPVGQTSMLRPYFDAGVGTDDATKKTTFLGNLGLRTEFIFPAGNNLFGLEPGMQLSLTNFSETRSDSRFNSFIALTARHVMGFRVRGFLPDAGVFFDAGYNFETFEVSSLTAKDEVNTNLELGVDLGFSHGRPKIGPFAIPRLRVGYRFGDIEGFRIRLGGDWLTTIKDPAETRASAN